jgi:hypothetical protein
MAKKDIGHLNELRRKQAFAVMDEIGPLLDAWESIPGDVKSQLEEEALDFCHYMRRIYLAVDGEVDGK